MIKILGLLIVFGLVGCGPQGSSSSKVKTPDPVEDKIQWDIGEESDELPSGSDPLYPASWHLNSTGEQSSFANNKARAGEDIGFQAALMRNRLGRGVRIAISDNGVDLRHEDLRTRVLEGESRNYSSSNASQWQGRDPAPTMSGSVAAHGTAVAGLAVAEGFNERGSRGVAPLARFAAFNYVGVSSSIAKTIDQASGNFDLFNYSYGRDSCAYAHLSSSYLEALRYGATSLRNGLGALYVKAAGNEFVSRRSHCFDDAPGNYAGNANMERDNNEPWVLVVGALNAFGEAAYYSTPGSSLWISAPGGDFGDTDPALVSTDLPGCDRGFSQTEDGVNAFDRGELPENANCAYTSGMNGTSGAAPIVTGALAVLLEERPSLGWRELKYVLARSARRVDPAPRAIHHPLGYGLSGHTYLEGWKQNRAGLWFHHWYGFGALDLEEALKFLSENDVSFGPWSEVSVEARELDLPIPDEDPAGVSHRLQVNEDLIVESVQVQLHIEHTFASDLGVELTSPSGTKSYLMTINNGIIDESLVGVTLATNAPYFERSRGEWTLRVIDGAQEDTGTLESWTLKISGHQPSTSQIVPRGQLAEGSVERTGQAVEGQRPVERNLASNNLDQSTSRRSHEELLKSGPRGKVYRDFPGETLNYVDERYLITRDELRGSLVLRDRKEEHERVVRADQFLAAQSSDDLLTVLTQRGPRLSIWSWQNSELSERSLNLRPFEGRSFELNSRLELTFINPRQELEVWSLSGERPFRQKKVEHVVHYQTSPNGDGLMLWTPGEFRWVANDGQVKKWNFARNISRFFFLPGSDSGSEGLLVAQVESAGALKTYGIEELWLLKIKGAQIEVLDEVRAEGELYLWDATFDQGLIYILGGTRTNFVQSNHGDLDLISLIYNKQGQREHTLHWGGEQKYFPASGEDYGHSLVKSSKGGLEIWGESTSLGPRGRKVLFTLPIDAQGGARGK